MNQHQRVKQGARRTASPLEAIDAADDRNAGSTGTPTCEPEFIKHDRRRLTIGGSVLVAALAVGSIVVSNSDSSFSPVDEGLGAMSEPSTAVPYFPGHSGAAVVPFTIFPYLESEAESSIVEIPSPTDDATIVWPQLSEGGAFEAAVRAAEAEAVAAAAAAADTSALLDGDAFERVVRAALAPLGTEG